MTKSKRCDRWDDTDEESDRSYYRRKYKELKHKKKKVRVVEDTSLMAYVATLDHVFFTVNDAAGNPLFLQADEKLQQIYRVLLDEFSVRWSKEEHVPFLDLKSVMIRDDKPFLLQPEKSSGGDSIPYAQIYKELVLDGFGDPKGNKVLEDFVNRLEEPALDLSDFQNLYFHQLLQSMTEIAFFPLDSVYKLGEEKTLNDGTESKNWEKMYEQWVNEYGQAKGKKIDLGKDCLKDPCATAVYDHKLALNDPYANTLVDQAIFVRNLIAHIYQYRRLANSKVDGYKVVQVVHSIAPDVSSDLYGLLYHCQVSMDFRGVRTLYELPPDRRVPES